MVRSLCQAVEYGIPLCNQVRDRVDRELRSRLWERLWGPGANILGPGSDQPFEVAVRMALDSDLFMVQTGPHAIRVGTEVVELPSALKDARSINE